MDALKCSDAGCGHVYAVSAAPMQGVQVHFDPEGECRQFHHRNAELVKYFRSTGFVLPTSNVLDVGAGAGHVAMATREVMPSVNITCVEADPAAKRWLRAQRFNVLDGLDDVQGAFDAIYLIEVIEHVDDPIDTLKKLRSLLSPHGRLFITTPCGQTTSGGFVRSAFETAEHVHFFTEKSLTKSLLATGFERPRFRTVRQMYRVSGSAPARTMITDAARFFRAKTLGHRHLVSIVAADSRRLGV